ncbi:MAG: DUF4249 family protein [Saprospiraceae bacterium]
MKNYLILIGVLFFGWQCQYPVDISSLPPTQKFIGIDIKVTEDYASANVFYSLESVTINGAYILPKPPIATATIIDSKGNKFELSNTKGIEDTLFKGKIGESYQVQLVADGKTYLSDKETMQASPAFDSLIVNYSRENFRPADNLYYDGFDIYALAHDIPGVENYYQWAWVHYSRAIYCDKVYSRAEGRDVLLQCYPPDCWNIEYNQNVIIQSDRLKDGNELAQNIVRVPYATPPKIYYIRIEQRAITPNVYAYFKSLEASTENRGTLFDIPAQTLFSPNIANVNDPDEKILGVFNVFSYRKRLVTIDMNQPINGAIPKAIMLPAPFSGDPFASAPCTEGTYRTQRKPPGWIN